MKLGKNRNKKGRDFHGKPYQENVTRRRNRKQEYKTKKMEERKGKWRCEKKVNSFSVKDIVFIFNSNWICRRLKQRVITPHNGK